MNHQRFIDLLAVRDFLTPDEAAELEDHLRRCPACRQIGDDFARQEAALRTLTFPDPSPAIRVGVLQKVGQPTAPRLPRLQRRFLGVAPLSLALIAIAILTLRFHGASGPSGSRSIHAAAGVSTRHAPNAAQTDQGALSRYAPAASKQRVARPSAGRRAPAGRTISHSMRPPSTRPPAPSVVAQAVPTQAAVGAIAGQSPSRQAALPSPAQQPPRAAAPPVFGRAAPAAPRRKTRSPASPPRPAPKTGGGARVPAAGAGGVPPGSRPPVNGAVPSPVPHPPPPLPPPAAPPPAAAPAATPAPYPTPVALVPARPPVPVPDPSPAPSVTTPPPATATPGSSATPGPSTSTSPSPEPALAPPVSPTP